MKKWLILGCFLIAKTASADLTIVQDLGGVPLSNYVDMDNVPNSDNLKALFESQKSNLDVTSINTDGLLLPQAQSEFSPGLVTKHPINLNLPTPFFIMGGDDSSLHWALQHADYLKSIHAQGFVIDVTSTEAIHDIEEKTGLTLIPGNVSGLSEVIGTDHYPVLVNQGWVSQ